MSKYGQKPETSSVEIANYTYYVGSLLTPKIKYPVSIYAGKHDKYIVTTPDRKFVLGSTFFGDEDGPGECIRQHMSPGLANTEDKGTGIETVLYLAGNMVAAAGEQDASGDFPWRMTSNNCTYSYTGDRTYAANRAWDNMVKHDLATRHEGDEEEIDERYDLDDFVSEDDVRESVYERVNDQHSGKIENLDISITGRVDVTGTVSGERVYEIIEWDTVAASGLVLFLGSDFADPLDRAIIPPKVFAEADWSQTSHKEFIAFAKQNAAVVAETNEERARAYIREIGQISGASRSAAARQRSDALFDLLNEGAMQYFPGMQPPPILSNPASTFTPLNTKWEMLYGHSTEWNPRKQLGKYAAPRKKVKRKSKPVKGKRVRNVKALIRNATK